MIPSLTSLHYQKTNFLLQATDKKHTDADWISIG